MAYSKSTLSRPQNQAFLGLAGVKGILDTVEAESHALLDILQLYRLNGRPGYPLRALWRAHIVRFILGLPTVNAMIRRLESDYYLRIACGFREHLPHRTTFNRFTTRLSLEQDLVDEIIMRITNYLQAILPDLGEKVAIDSTNIPTHASPHKPSISDPEASWTAKTNPRQRRQKEWHFGYKEHALVDVKYGAVIARYTTSASQPDMNHLTPLLDKAAELHPTWFRPKYVMCDKGYDSTSSHAAVIQRGATPIIPIRQLPKNTSKCLHTSRNTHLHRSASHEVRP